MADERCGVKRQEARPPVLDYDDPDSPVYEGGAPTLIDKVDMERG